MSWLHLAIASVTIGRVLLVSLEPRLIFGMLLLTGRKYSNCLKLHLPWAGLAQAAMALHLLYFPGRASLFLIGSFVIFIRISRT